MSVSSPDIPADSSTTFEDLGLSAALLRAVADQGYTEPSPIQCRAIPAVLAGRDVLGAAQTGTGKTAGFVLPILQRLAQTPTAEGGQFLGNTRRPNTRAVRALVLTPTRELAAQVLESVQTYGKYSGLSAAAVYGGVAVHPQIIKLRKGVDVLVATPGRLLDLISQNAVTFAGLEVLVLDEADRMLDMGFIHDMRRIVALLPETRQTLLFSATFSPEIRKLARDFLQNPVQIDISPGKPAAETVAQRVYPVAKADKPRLLAHLIKSGDWEQVLVFTRTKHGADRLVRKLKGEGVAATAIHGNKSQNQRTRALQDFKRGVVRVLVATDIAARGLDIVELPHVVNFELPTVPEDYVHRIGRTGRAGAAGEAASLVSEDETKLLAAIERVLGRKLPLERVPGFSAAAPLPKAAPTPSQGREGERPKAARSPGRREAQAAPARSDGEFARRRRGRGPRR